MTVEQYCTCEPPGIGNGPDPECTAHRSSDNKVTTSEQVVLSSNQSLDDKRHAAASSSADGLCGDPTCTDCYDPRDAEIERLVSRNAQLEEESLKRDTELRMERDTNTEHCKARVALEAELAYAKANTNTATNNVLAENVVLKAELDKTQKATLHAQEHAKYMGNKALALQAELADKALADSAIANIRKLCREIMGGNCSFVDDDFGRALITLRDERDQLFEQKLTWGVALADMTAERDRLEELTDRQSKHIVDVAYENGQLREALERCKKWDPALTGVVDEALAGVDNPPKSSPVGG